MTRWLIAVGLALGADYGAWRWSTSAASDIPALVTGLALALLAVAFVWLLMLATLEGLLRASRGFNGLRRPRSSEDRRRREAKNSVSEAPRERIAA